MKKKILVTGGLGYIGSHTVVELQHAGYEVVIIDSLINSQKFILDRIEQITSIRPVFYEANLCDRNAILSVFETEKYFDVVIHFAALKAVGESVKIPLIYFKNNLISLLNLLEFMETYNCKNFLFSSSATVYGDPAELPLKETSPFKKALSAYGSTKQMGEDILEKVAATGNINVISLRYFNPVGAHESGLIGELPLGTPNNLMPFVTQTAIGKQKHLTVFGNDHPTPDGYCVRDYIHVVDLAKAHEKSCDRLVQQNQQSFYETFNIGTGNGFSVLEVIKTFEEENKVRPNYVIGKKREGDAAATYADVAKANTILNWKAEKGLKDMVKDAWRWEKAISI